jgi:hypothetical protein
LLATSVPQMFHYIPNPMNISVPRAPNSSISGSPSGPSSYVAPPPALQNDYPHIAYWNRRDYDETDLTSITEDKQSKLQFLEHEDGSLFLKVEIDETRKHARQAFQTLLDEKISPPTWSQASSTASNFFRREMLSHCPELRLCANNWKVDALATEIYSQWIRRRREKVLEQSGGTELEQIATTIQKKRKSEDHELEQQDVQKSRSKTTKRQKPNPINLPSSQKRSSATIKPIASTSTSRITTTTSHALATTTTTTSNAPARKPASSALIFPDPIETESEEEDPDKDDLDDDDKNFETPEEHSTRSKGKGKAREQPKGKEGERREVTLIKLVNPLYVFLRPLGALAFNLTISSSKAFPNKSTAKASRLDTVPDIAPTYPT